ncbi:MAG: type II toxin-antitoxin system HipA family toxin YjjJ [Moraxellaceae bacterium]|nr:type II toxin-antitoxin system HipA family toxin YjjJ [Moraxellaceae bacterium]
MTRLPDLLTLLANGPLLAGTVVERLGISRPTLSRLVATAGDRVIRYGTARATAYAARRSVAGLGAWPVYRIGEDGRAISIATLHAVAGGYLAELHEHGRAEFSEGLPWWLQDMRPQGFLGRAFAHQHARRLNLPDTLNLWNDDHALIAIAALGNDTPGNLLVGDMALADYLQTDDAPAITMSSRTLHYPAFATAALAGETPGSSAGGEQPKFTTELEVEGQRCAVLVKFSSAADNAISCRWASLLVAEHHAQRALHAGGLPTSPSTLFETGDQMFLQIERFDRLPSPAGGAHHLGRRGMVSLAALDDAFVGKADQAWPVITASLVAQGRIAPEVHLLAERLYAFGLLIGNTDMHRGNLSFLHTGGILQLAPSYDMLPMHYAPRISGEMNDSAPEIRFRSPPSLEAWRDMLPLAQAWARSAAADTRIDHEMRTAIGIQVENLERFGASLGA